MCALGQKIRVLIVDDSVFMRKALAMILKSDPNITVVGAARNGIECLEMAAEFKPDMITMDIEMPRMDGLTALHQIMISEPTPVIMVSSLTTDGASATLDALELGAVDFITKDSAQHTDRAKMKEEILKKVRDIGNRRNIIMTNLRRQGARLKRESEAKHPTQKSSAAPPVKAIDPISPPPPRVQPKRSHQVSLIAIGTSTGGPPTLKEIITQLPRNLPCGIVIAQHMPPTFTKSMADRLNSLSEVSVKEAESGEAIEPGHVYVAPGGRHMITQRHAMKGRLIITDKPEEALYRPCVDLLFSSVARHYGAASLGIILTGMGNDGLIGMREMKSKGAVAIAQDAESCIVYGMPKAIVDDGLADYILPSDRIAGEIAAYF